jgi:hypothetical protein
MGHHFSAAFKQALQAHLPTKWQTHHRHRFLPRCRRRRSEASPSQYPTTTARRRVHGGSARAGGRQRVALASAPCGCLRGGGPSCCSSQPSRCYSSRPRASAPRPPLPRPCLALDGLTRQRASFMACASVSTPPFSYSI